MTIMSVLKAVFGSSHRPSSENIDAMAASLTGLERAAASMNGHARELGEHMGNGCGEEAGAHVRQTLDR